MDRTQSRAFYCQAPHHQANRRPLLGILPPGASGVLTCADPRCRSRFFCAVGVRPVKGELPGRQIPAPAAAAV